MHRDAPPGSLPHLPSALEARLRSPTRAPARPEPRTEAKPPEPRRDQSRASQAVPEHVLAPPPRRRERPLCGRDQNRPSRTPQRHVFHLAGLCSQAAREGRGTRRPVEAQGPEVTGTGKARARIKNSPPSNLAGHFSSRTQDGRPRPLGRIGNAAPDGPRDPILAPHATGPDRREGSVTPSRRTSGADSHPASERADGPTVGRDQKRSFRRTAARISHPARIRGQGPTVGRDQKRPFEAGLRCVPEPAGGTGAWGAGAGRG